MIADREKAQRLARAIVADLKLYHGENIREGRGLPFEAKEEARSLFAGRVSPDLRSLLDEELGDMEPLRDAPFGYRDVGPERPRGSSRTLVTTVLVVVGIAIVVFAVLLCVRLVGVR
ncbi:MAG: hypothetical protein ACXWUE_24660 [Polyangiales bacterium]